MPFSRLGSALIDEGGGVLLVPPPAQPAGSPPPPVVAVPVPVPVVSSVPPPPPVLSTPAQALLAAAGVTQAQVDAATQAAMAAGAGAAALLAGGGSEVIAAAERAAGATPEVVQAVLALGIPDVIDLGLPTPAAADESFDSETPAEAGDEPTSDAVDYWDLEAFAFESGQLEPFMVSHPPPGTLIGYPYQGSHSKAVNIAGGSDNWQSENAVDVWLYPGTHVTACEDGVISPGSWGYGESKSGGRFAGWRLHLVASGGKVFFYTHLAGLQVLKGQRVKKGDYIGDSGVAVSVPHLHFAVNPPFDPRAFYRDAFTLKGRTSIGTSPRSGGPPAHAPNVGDVEVAWSQLTDVFSHTLVAFSSHAKDARRELLKVLG